MQCIDIQREKLLWKNRKKLQKDEIQEEKNNFEIFHGIKIEGDEYHQLSDVDEFWKGIEYICSFVTEHEGKQKKW